MEKYQIIRFYALYVNYLACNAHSIRNVVNVKKDIRSKINNANVFKADL